jgi:hypothetical protein
MAFLPTKQHYQTGFCGAGREIYLKPKTGQKIQR